MSSGPAYLQEWFNTEWKSAALCGHVHTHACVCAERAGLMDSGEQAESVLQGQG